jgi:hypothetical protein
MESEQHLYAAANSFEYEGVGFTNSFAGVANTYRRRRGGREHVHKTEGTGFGSSFRSWSEWNAARQIGAGSLLLLFPRQAALSAGRRITFQERQRSGILVWGWGRSGACRHCGAGVFAQS